MRIVVRTALCLLIPVLAVCLGMAGKEDKTNVRLRLLDGQTGKPIGGIVRVFLGEEGPPASPALAREEGSPLAIPGLYDRLRGLKTSKGWSGWHVVPRDGGRADLPRTLVRLEALSGLETGLATRTVDLRKEPAEEISIELPVLFRPQELGLVAGNTHLHLRDMTQVESDEYLRLIPPADGLDVLFISYLERAGDDQAYITNRYPIGELARLSDRGTLVGNGEEHRHNLQGYGQGYGHVMLLGISRLVQPVSIGAGIMGVGLDEPALRPGIDEARRQGGTIIWCHNTFGHESVPNVLAGRVHAINVFDGSRRDGYEDLYYPLLNVGLRLPISTGTDWFQYDFSRVYVPVEGKATLAGWLDGIRQGRCIATNGPLLDLQVNGQGIGRVLDLARVPQRVRVEASATGRVDFTRLQLVHNGKVIHAEPARKIGAGHGARIERELVIEGPGWLAARIECQNRNELGQQLFAHTAPVYLDVASRQSFDVESARLLLRRLEESRADIRARAKFGSPQAAAAIDSLYEESIQLLAARMEKGS